MSSMLATLCIIFANTAQAAEEASEAVLREVKWPDFPEDCYHTQITIMTTEERLMLEVGDSYLSAIDPWHQEWGIRFYCLEETSYNYTDGVVITSYSSSFRYASNEAMRLWLEIPRSELKWGEAAYFIFEVGVVKISRPSLASWNHGE